MSAAPKPADSRTAEIRRLAKTDEDAATRLLGELIADLFGISPVAIAINHDRYSLNSLNGFFEADGKPYFFKFHQEEGEDAEDGEYYRADILKRAGLPVDQPVLMSALPGEQMLVYRRRQDPRFSDVLRAIDLAPDPAAGARALDAEERLDACIGGVYERSLHAIGPEQARAEVIHRLFYLRLIDTQSGAFPGGRLKSFYVGADFRFPGLTFGWDDFSKRHLVFGGRRYRRTVGELFTAAHARLAPDRLADAGGVVAHGDAHNANVWFGTLPDGRAELSFYDPAFAGEHVPSLLAEIKATFHNVFAHPLWLYDPAACAARYHAAARLDGNDLVIDTDWALTPIRRALLEAKARIVWKPLLARLAGRGLLPADWRQVIRLALFLCPTLVMNLRAGSGSHNEISSAIAFAVAVMVGSEPDSGSDPVTDFLDAIAP